MLLIGAEFGGILLYIRGNQPGGLRNHTGNVHTVQKIGKICMVQLGIGAVLQNPVNHGAVAAAGAGQGCVNVIVDRSRSAAVLKTAKGQIIIPGDHRNLPGLFIKVVVVYHTAGVAVSVDGKIVHHKISENGIHIYSVAVQLTERLQRLYEPGFVGISKVGFGVVEDVGVAFGGVVDILQLHICAAHTAKTALLSILPREFHLFGRLKTAIRIKVGSWI